MQPENVKRILDIWTEELVQCFERLNDQTAERVKGIIRDARAQFEEILKASDLSGEMILTLLGDPRNLVFVKTFDSAILTGKEGDEITPYDLMEPVKRSLAEKPNHRFKKCRVILLVENMEEEQDAKN